MEKEIKGNNLINTHMVLERRQASQTIWSDRLLWPIASTAKLKRGSKK